jgi:nucleoside-diphosphate-sugar epimerase
MRVLLTGATTPLGCEIARQLLAQRRTEIVLAVGHEPDPRPLQIDARLHYQATDLRHARAVHDLLWGPGRAHAIDVVIHAGQHRAVLDSGPAVHAQNVDATRHLVLACSSHPTVSRFIYRSFAEVYSLRYTTSDLLDEEAPLDFDPSAPQWVRDRVEADLGVCAHLGGRLGIAVLRCAEIVAPQTGSQLWDYLQSRVCLRPFGFDPMLNVLSLEDAGAAFVAAARAREATGVFNIAGGETLPLSRAIAEAYKMNIPVPGSAMAPLYGLRRWIVGHEFRYDMNMRRFHFGGVLDGTRARDLLGFVPRTAVRWPRPWWRTLLETLGSDHPRS